MRASPFHLFTGDLNATRIYRLSRGLEYRQLCCKHCGLYMAIWVSLLNFMARPRDVGGIKLEDGCIAFLHAIIFLPGRIT